MSTLFHRKYNIALFQDSYKWGGLEKVRNVVICEAGGWNVAYIYQCEDSLEGIFTAIYNIYRDRRNFPDTCISIREDLLLFAQYVPVETSSEAAVKVMRTCREKFGEKDFYGLCMALASYDTDKAQAVYKTIAYGLMVKPKKGHLFDHLSDDNVLKAFKLSNTVCREVHHLYGFVRFRELENGILFSDISPKNHVLVSLMEHFSDRMPSENFAIFDAGRKLYGIHPARGQWFLAKGEELESQIQNVPVTYEEERYAELFRHFCKRIAIKERRNPELQRNMLPLYFREYMTEFM